MYYVHLYIYSLHLHTETNQESSRDQRGPLTEFSVEGDHGYYTWYHLDRRCCYQAGCFPVEPVTRLHRFRVFSNVITPPHPELRIHEPIKIIKSLFLLDTRAHMQVAGKCGSPCKSCFLSRLLLPHRHKVGPCKVLAARTSEMAHQAKAHPSIYTILLNTISYRSIFYKWNRCESARHALVHICDLEFSLFNSAYIILLCLALRAVRQGIAVSQNMFTPNIWSPTVWIWEAVAGSISIISWREPSQNISKPYDTSEIVANAVCLMCFRCAKLLDSATWQIMDNTQSVSKN